MRNTTKKVIIIVIIYSLCALFALSCSLFGGDMVKPVAKLETEMELVKKDIDKSKKEYGDVYGDLKAIEQRITQIETNITTINQQISNQTNIETPFWKIVTPIIIGYAIWELLKLAWYIARKKKII